MTATAKTHCPSGHSYDEKNTYVNPTTGERNCRWCKRIAAARNRPHRREKESA